MGISLQRHGMLFLEAKPLLFIIFCSYYNGIKICGLNSYLFTCYSTDSVPWFPHLLER